MMDAEQTTAAFQPAQAEAWASFINETTAPRQRYDRVVNDARDRFDRIKAAAQASASIATEIAWEQLQAELIAAYQAYESDTRPARAMRNWSLEQGTAIELRQ